MTSIGTHRLPLDRTGSLTTLSPESTTHSYESPSDFNSHRDMQVQATHPYYPLSVAIPGYVANSTPVWRLLPAFGGMIAAVLFLSDRLAVAGMERAGVGRSGLRPIDRFAVWWFALCEFFSRVLSLSRCLVDG